MNPSELQSLPHGTFIFVCFKSFLRVCLSVHVCASLFHLSGLPATRDGLRAVLLGVLSSIKISMQRVVRRVYLCWNFERNELKARSYEQQNIAQLVAQHCCVATEENLLRAGRQYEQHSLRNLRRIFPHTSCAALPDLTGSS